MKSKSLLALLFAIIPFIWGGVAADEYIILSWNDLGMHCANKDFQNLCVLPPYNNIKAQVIKRGSATALPVIINTGFTVDYSIPGNTYSVGKTNFWSYAFQLFGVNLAPDIGLKGAGLTGTMSTVDNNYFVEGVPLTPFQDNNLVTENPFQLALIELKDGNGSVIKTTQPVIPVSNEINCVSSGCHSSETDILNAHEQEGGFNPNNKPILCASCHSSNALGTAGKPGVPSLSLAIHGKHKDITNDCYKCHPGTNAQCFRDVMHSAGMVCQDCHGSVATVAGTIENGRNPWLQEPSCGATNCHGSNYAEETGKLFRQSRGHGGLFCSACHGSPHAIQPTVQPNDNVQNIAIQGHSGVLRKCDVCHGYTPASGGPHGFNPTGLEELSRIIPDKNEITNIFPNPFTFQATISFTVAETGKIRMEVFSSNGARILLLLNQQMQPGSYQVKTPVNILKPGAYIVKLRTNKNTGYRKMIAQ